MRQIYKNYFEETRRIIKKSPSISLESAMKLNGKKRIAIFLMLMILLVISNLAISKFNTQQAQVIFQDNDHIRMGEKGEENSSEKKSEYGPFYKIPSSFWPKITILGTASAVMMYVALIFGFTSFFIGYNAGGRLAKGKVIAAIVTATTIGVLSRSIFIKVKVLIFDLLTKNLFEWNEMIVGTALDIFCYIFTIAYVAAIAVFIYETFTVTAREAFSSR